MIFRKCWGVNGCLELFRKFILLVGTGFPYLGWTLKKTDEQRHRRNKQERENRCNKQERESEGEVKRGRLIGWKSGITPLLGQGSCGKQALWEEVWGKYLTFCQSHTNWIFLHILRSASLASHVHKWLNCSGNVNNYFWLCVPKSSIMGQGRRRSFFFVYSPPAEGYWYPSIYKIGYNGLLRRVNLSHAFYHPLPPRLTSKMDIKGYVPPCPKTLLNLGNFSKQWLPEICCPIWERWSYNWCTCACHILVLCYLWFTEVKSELQLMTQCASVVCSNSVGQK